MVQVSSDTPYLSLATRRFQPEIEACVQGLPVKRAARLSVSGEVGDERRVGTTTIDSASLSLPDAVTGCLQTALAQVTVPERYPSVTTGAVDPHVGWSLLLWNTEGRHPPERGPVAIRTATPEDLSTWLERVGWEAPPPPGPDAWHPVSGRGSGGATKTWYFDEPDGAGDPPLTLSTDAGPAPLSVSVTGPAELVAKQSATYHRFEGCGFTIDWGDGMPMSRPACGENLTHRYAYPGTYRVKAARHHAGPEDGTVVDWLGASQVTVTGTGPTVDRVSEVVATPETFGHGEPVEVAFDVEITAPAKAHVAVVDDRGHPLAAFAWGVGAPGSEAIRFELRNAAPNPRYGGVNSVGLTTRDGVQHAQAMTLPLSDSLTQRRQAWEAASMRGATSGEVRVWLERDGARVGETRTTPIGLSSRTLPGANVRFGVLELSPLMGYLEATKVRELGCRSWLVDWGDGTTEVFEPDASCAGTEQVDVGPLAHPYAKPGTYTVTLRGDEQPTVTLERVLVVDGAGVEVPTDPSPPGE
jgi:hypothetical protein